jgi:hypothetical protein
MFTKLHLYRASARITPALISNSHGHGGLVNDPARSRWKTLLSTISALCPFD